MAQCNAVAEVMVGSSTTFIDFATGLALGTRLGWPKQRLSDLNDRRDAMMQVFMAEEAEDAKNGSWSCSAVERGNAFMRRRAQVGELEAARELVERSGESVPELARQERERIDNMRLEAQRRAQNSAASSAAGGSGRRRRAVRIKVHIAHLTYRPLRMGNDSRH